MSKKRNRKARLGKVAPAVTRGQDRLFHAKADSKNVHFQRLWARKGDTITVSLSDILDFGLNRRVTVGDRSYVIGLKETGVYVRDEGSAADRTLVFQDLLALVSGQMIIPTNS